MHFARFISSSFLFSLYFKMAASRSQRFTEAEVCHLLDDNSDADGDVSDKEIEALTRNAIH